MSFRRGHYTANKYIYEETEINITFVNLYNFLKFKYFMEHSIPLVVLKYLSLLRTPMQKYSHIFATEDAVEDLEIPLAISRMS